MERGYLGNKGIAERIIVKRNSEK